VNTSSAAIISPAIGCIHWLQLLGFGLYKGFIMAKKAKFLDVWIVETNTVYSRVPYTVITDWAQEGRLLGDDKVRASGTGDWIALADVPAFAVFLPKTEPLRVEDQAEALEPVHIDFSWKPRRGDEDEDVDMIPLIDISLVLLIFFMLTAAVAGPTSIFNIPQAEYMQLVEIKPEMLWIGVRYEGGKNKQPKTTFSLGQGDKKEVDHFDSRDVLLKALANRLQDQRGAKIRIRSDKEAPCEIVTQGLAVDLEAFKAQGKVSEVFLEVTEKEIP
jgi:biopolymer transport protein ExbD